MLIQEVSFPAFQFIGTASSLCIAVTLEVSVDHFANGSMFHESPAFGSLTSDGGCVFQALDFFQALYLLYRRTAKSRQSWDIWFAPFPESLI